MKNFRAWDKTEKQMYYHFDFPDRFVVTLDLAVFDMESENQIMPGLGAIVADRFVMQASTLRTDQNNREIFEGDIIKMTSYNFQHLNHLQWEVFYDSDSMSFKFRSGTNIECVNGWHSLEVVGNIFENPRTL